MNYLLVCIVSYSGLLAGVIVSLLAKEELVAGRKYFLLMQNVVLSSIFVIGLYSINLSWYAAAFGGLLVVFLLYWLRKRPLIHFIYPLFAVLMYFASMNGDVFQIVASLVFLYGIPTSALHISFKKSYASLFYWTASFVIISFLLGFI
jgi:hypothetical protein